MQPVMIFKFGPPNLKKWNYTLFIFYLSYNSFPNYIFSTR